MRSLLALLILLTFSAVAQTVITQVGVVYDKSGNGIAVSKSTNYVSVTCSDSEESVTTSIGLTTSQARQFQGYLNKAFNGRQMGIGKSADYGTIRAQNSEISALVTDNKALVCVTEGRLNRFYYLDGGSYNKLQTLLAKATGSRAARASEPVQPKQPGINGPDYPTH